jgi:hypothetical protein
VDFVLRRDPDAGFDNGPLDMDDDESASNAA